MSEAVLQLMLYYAVDSLTLCHSLHPFVHLCEQVNSKGYSLNNYFSDIFWVRADLRGTARKMPNIVLLLCNMTLKLMYGNKKNWYPLLTYYLFSCQL